MQNSLFTLSIVIFGYWTYLNVREMRKMAMGFQDILCFGPTWQLCATILIILLNSNAWHLLWCIPVSFVVAFAFQSILTPSRLIAVAEELNVADRKDFIAFANSKPQIRNLFAHVDSQSALTSPSGPLRRFNQSNQLVMMSENFREAGNTADALQSLRWALKFEPYNYVAWMGFAYTHLALDDRCAGRWARKVLGFKSSMSPSPVIQSMYEELVENNAEEKQEISLRMRNIISECDKHPEWHDTYDWLIPFGLES